MNMDIVTGATFGACFGFLLCMWLDSRARCNEDRMRATRRMANSGGFVPPAAVVLPEAPQQWDFCKDPDCEMCQSQRRYRLSENDGPKPSREAIK